MENGTAKNTVIASSPYLPTCPGREAIARGRWRVSMVILFASNAVLF